MFADALGHIEVIAANCHCPADRRARSASSIRQRSVARRCEGGVDCLAEVEQQFLDLGRGRSAPASPIATEDPAQRVFAGVANHVGSTGQREVCPPRGRSRAGTNRGHSREELPRSREKPPRSREERGTLLRGRGLGRDSPARASDRMVPTGTTLSAAGGGRYGGRRRRRRATSPWTGEEQRLGRQHARDEQNQSGGPKPTTADPRAQRAIFANTLPRPRRSLKLAVPGARSSCHSFPRPGASRAGGGETMMQRCSGRVAHLAGAAAAHHIGRHWGPRHRRRPQPRHRPDVAPRRVKIARQM